MRNGLAWPPTAIAPLICLVVRAVRLRHLLDPAYPLEPKGRKATVNDAVVHDHVRRSERGDADGEAEDGRAAEASFDELRPVHDRQDQEHVRDAEDIVVLEWTLVALAVVGGVDLPESVASHRSRCA